MRAAVVPRFGRPEVFELREVPDPPITRGDQLRVRLGATSVNPIDTYLRGGKIPTLARPPLILGGDGCGVVESVGADVRGFAVGERVFGLRPYIRGEGCYAELAIFRERELAPAPAGRSDAELASVPLVGLTSLQALVDHAGLQPGARLLIHGGSGGVGTIAIQIGKALGATVYATASPRNHALLRELGADEALDYHAGEHRRLRALDVVFDTIGSYYRESLPLLRRGGRLISTTPLGDDERVGLGNLLKHGGRVLASALRAPLGGARAAMVRVRPDGAGMRRIAAWIESGAVRPRLAATYPLEQIAEAHRQSQGKRAVGKIAITIGGSR